VAAMKFKTIPEVEEKVVALNRRAEQRAQEMVMRAPADPDEVYVAMMSHMMALIGLAKANDPPVPPAMLHQMLDTGWEIVRVTTLGKAAGDA
jgi:hypothetical protein